MPSSINIDPKFPTHWKTLKLIRLAGEGAPFALVRLWCYAHDNCPTTGDLSMLEREGIEDVSLWRGERGLFCQALLDSGFLDQDLRLHDWCEHEAHLIAYKAKADHMNAVRQGRGKVDNKQVNKEVTCKSTTLSQASQQGSALASDTVTVTGSVTEPEGRLSNGSTAGEIPGTSSAGAEALSLTRKENKPAGDLPKRKLNGDDVEEQPLRVLEIAKFITNRWPNATIRQRETLAGRIERLARERKHEFTPDQAARFAELVLADAISIITANAFVTVLEKPEEAEQVYQLVAKARNGRPMPTNGAAYQHQNGRAP